MTLDRVTSSVDAASGPATWGTSAMALPPAGVDTPAAAPENRSDVSNNPPGRDGRPAS